MIDSALFAKWNGVFICKIYDCNSKICNL